MKGPFILFLMAISLGITAQEKDSTKQKFNYTPKVITTADSNTVFEAKRRMEENEEGQAKLSIGGYVSTYFAYYDDETNNNGFVQFPTMAARNKEFGLNTALISMKYSAKNVRSSLGFHFGDIATTVWPEKYNMVQEANAGVKLIKKLWLDAGFFKSHVGVESTEPRENITSSMSLANNFEPYFFAGAKLSYELNEKFLIQLNSFNSYGSFVDNNKNKLIGTSIVFTPNKKLSFTYNFLTGTETPDSVKTKQQRNYNNFYITYSSKKFLLGFETNYGWQTNSSRNDSSQNAHVYSGLLVMKYQLHRKLGVYGRQEYFIDKDQVLTGSLDTGNGILGTTLGIEYKPMSQIAISIEGRNLSGEKLIYRQGNKVTNQRNEIIFCLDIWF